MNFTLEPTEDKENSCPYEIRQSEALGRFLIASQDIPSRGFIIREKPMVFGPADTDRYDASPASKYPVCLGCFTRMTHDPEYRCPTCSWPVCNDECAAMSCHSQNECKYFSKTQIVYPPPNMQAINKSILVFRCCLLKRLGENLMDLSLWNELLKLEHHNDIRKKKHDCIVNDERVLGNLQHFLKVTNELSHPLESEDCIFFSNGQTPEELSKFQDEVLKICGIVNVNAFTTVKEDDESDKGVIIAQCLYLKSSLFSHSCVPNATWAIGPPPTFVMSIRASIPILKGDMITIPYSVRDNLYGTLQRIISTEDVAHFTCHCERCLDPTELSTFVSAIKCSNCPKGYLLPIEPTIASSKWQCQILLEDDKENHIDDWNSQKATQIDRDSSCSQLVSVNKIVHILHDMENQIENIRRKARSYSNESYSIICEQFEDLGKKCQQVFHRNHYLMQEIRFCILKKQASQLKNLSEAQRIKFIHHCECLLEIANTLTPGYCNHRAFLQFYLARALHVHVYEQELELKRIQQQTERPSDDNKQNVIMVLMTRILNIYQRIRTLEKEVFFQTECEFEFCDENQPKPFYFDKLCSRIEQTEQRIKELECEMTMTDT